MAKRKTARKARSSTRGAARRSGARKRARKINLREIRMQLATGATRLRGMIRAGAAGRARLARKEAALSRMAVTLAAFCDEEMQKICGPDMAI